MGTSLNIGRSWNVVFWVFLCSCVPSAGFWAGEAGAEQEEKGTNALEAPVDVSKVQAPYCKRCHGSGFGSCTFCNGSGFSHSAEIKCPKCDGKGWTECTRCNEEGKIRCTKCKLRKLNGEMTRCLVSPAWREWRREYGDKVGVVTEEEPEKYIVCPKCAGTGFRICPDCEGTKHAKCDRCQGDGLIKGKGACTKCDGTGHVPCSVCGHIDGEEEIDSLLVLEKLKKEKLLNEIEYFKRRRLIIAQEKYRREVLAARKQKEDEKKELAETAAPGVGETTPSEKVAVAGIPETKTVDWDTLKERHRMLLQGLRTKVISTKQYAQKVRELGLDEAMLEEAEKDIAELDPLVKKLLETKEAFRKGTIDYREYQSRVKDL